MGAGVTGAGDGMWITVSAFVFCSLLRKCGAFGSASLLLTGSVDLFFMRRREVMGGGGGMMGWGMGITVSASVYFWNLYKRDESGRAFPLLTAYVDALLNVLRCRVT